MRGRARDARLPGRFDLVTALARLQTVVAFKCRRWAQPAERLSPKLHLRVAFQRGGALPRAPEPLSPEPSGKAVRDDGLPGGCANFRSFLERIFPSFWQFNERALSRID